MGRFLEQAFNGSPRMLSVATGTMRYAQAMARRFAGLRVTDEPMDIDLLGGNPLPSERLWDIGPH